MVHGELIKQGLVKKLTFQQLEKLERIDARKERHRLKMERRREIDNQLLEIVKQIPLAGGYALGQAFNGMGEAIQGYLSGDALAFAAKSVAGLIFLEWLVASFPRFAELTHLDWLAIRNHAQTPNAQNFNQEAQSDIADLKASYPNAIVPSWLTQMATAKTLGDMPDLTQPIRQLASQDLINSFLQDSITQATGGGDAPLIADIHKLYEDYKLQLSGAQGTGINPYISQSFGNIL